MAKATLLVAVLLIILGIVGYYSTDYLTSHALVPSWWGLVLGVGGYLVIKSDGNRRKLVMYFNTAIATLGFLFSLAAAINGYASARSAAIAPNYTTMVFKLIAALILFVYVNICIRYFLEERRKRVQ